MSFIVFGSFAACPRPQGVAGSPHRHRHSCLLARVLGYVGAMGGNIVAMLGLFWPFWGLENGGALRREVYSIYKSMVWIKRTRFGNRSWSVAQARGF